MKYLFQVGLHELLGHGSGKLLERGNFPANLTNPLTGKRVESFYEPGEDFKSVFSDVNSAYEECRAEAVALYLGTEERILRSVTVKTLSLIANVFEEKNGKWSPLFRVTKSAHSCRCPTLVL